MKNPERIDLAKVTKYYGYLFSLPKYYIILILEILTCVAGSLTSFVIAYNSLTKLLDGLIFSLLAFIIPINVADVILFNFIIKKDLILDKRRGAGLSLVICIICVAIINLGAVLQVTLRSPYTLSYAALFTVSLALSFRYLVVSTITYLKSFKLTLAILLQPFLYLLSLLYFFNMWQLKFFLAVFTSCLIFLVSSYFFISLINRKGIQVIGIGSISLLKAFLANWIANAFQPLEKYFDELGSESTFLVNLLVFKKENSIEIIMVVPTIHPGPFKNLGSSNLPYLIKDALEKRYNTITAVPHGTCDHKSNLTSQEECKKTLEQIINSAKFSNFNVRATKFIREEGSFAKASCQIFGDVALVTLTCAPSNMEDIPTEVGLEIIERGKKLGAKDVIVIDAHNSLDVTKGPLIPSDARLKDIILTAEKAIKRALNEEKHFFKVGVSQIYPREFGVKEGIGPGGIVVFATAVGEQKVAYIVIDGNNMIRGFREEILKSIIQLVHDGEVLTTDTHVVNAVLPIKQGYYTVGEAVDTNTLLLYIKKGISQAIINFGYSKTTYKIVEVKGVKCLKEKIRTLFYTLDLTYKYTKTISPLIYVPSVSAALLSFIIILFNMIR